MLDHLSDRLSGRTIPIEPIHAAYRDALGEGFEGLADEVARIQQIWADCRQHFGKAGPFLFGTFTVADGMYAPVVTRFVTYGIKLMPVAASYVETMMGLPAMKDWVNAAKRETWVIDYPDPTKA